MTEGIYDVVLGAVRGFKAGVCSVASYLESHGKSGIFLGPGKVRKPGDLGS